MQLLHCLFFIRASFEISLNAIYIKGEDNVRADALSKNNLCMIFAQAPKTNSHPTAIPESAVELLVWQQPDWLSPS